MSISRPPVTHTPPPGYPLRPLAVARDPFAAGASMRPDLVQQPAGCTAGGCSPPRSLPAATARIVAILTGNHPSATVEFGDERRVVVLGDRIGDAAVARITPSGVTLTDGTILNVMPAASAPALVSGDGARVPPIPIGISAPAAVTLPSVDEGSR